MNPDIKNFLNNPNNQNLIQKNDWKSILLGDILNGTFSTFEDFCQIMRDAGIPIDSYFNKVFNQFEVKEQLPEKFFNNEGKWEQKIIGATEKEFHLINNNNNFTYGDLWFIFVQLQNRYNLDLFPGDGDLKETINKDNLKIISNITIDVDNTYLIYSVKVYCKNESQFYAYKYVDTLGRIIPNYGYGYNLSEFDKINQIIVNHLKSKGLEILVDGKINLIFEMNNKELMNSYGMDSKKLLINYGENANKLK